MASTATFSKPERRTVVGFDTGRDGVAPHELATLRAIGAELAKLHLGGYAPSPAEHGGEGMAYFVPDDTISCALATDLGIRSVEDFFGGAVPFDFVATKSITHPLLDGHAVVPLGWNARFPEGVTSIVPRGISVFSVADAFRAGRELLKQSAIRFKPSKSRGGGGQTVVVDEFDLRRAVDGLDDKDIERFGLVIEENLRDVVTRSVGTVTTAGMSVSYIGEQYLTKNNAGHSVYGGSDLLVSRGDIEALRNRPLDARSRIAVEQAMQYDTAAHDAFPELIASRRNYDVVQAVDVSGAWVSGVLEQSWRLGGATPAEIAAFATFVADPGREVVRVRSVERYGTGVEVPQGATVYFSGDDPAVGRLTKFAVVID